MRDVTISGFLVKRVWSQKYALNAKALIGTNHGKIKENRPFVKRISMLLLGIGGRREDLNF